MLALPVRPLDLENGFPGRNDMGDGTTGERLLEHEIPLLRALLDEPRKPFLPGSV